MTSPWPFTGKAVPRSKPMTSSAAPQRPAHAVTKVTQVAVALQRGGLDSKDCCGGDRGDRTTLRAASCVSDAREGGAAAPRAVAGATMGSVIAYRYRCPVVRRERLAHPPAPDRGERGPAGKRHGKSIS